jgi:hypothetical protein
MQHFVVIEEFGMMIQTRLPPPCANSPDGSISRQQR